MTRHGRLKVGFVYDTGHALLSKEPADRTLITGLTRLIISSPTTCSRKMTFLHYRAADCLLLELMRKSMQAGSHLMIVLGNVISMAFRPGILNTYVVLPTSFLKLKRLKTACPLKGRFECCAGIAYVLSSLTMSKSNR